MQGQPDQFVFVTISNLLIFISLCVLVVKGSAERAYDQVVLGSIPTASKLFSVELVISKQCSQQRIISSSF